jgi:hypothetical protein
MGGGGPDPGGEHGQAVPLVISENPLQQPHGKALARDFF